MLTDIETIQAYCDRIAEQFQPEKIILFGSYAYGTPTDDSDVDILVVLPFEGNSHHKVAEIRVSLHPPFPPDIIARTPENLSWRISQNDWFLRDIVEKGKVLYEARDARVDSNRPISRTNAVTLNE